MFDHCAYVYESIIFFILRTQTKTVICKIGLYFFCINYFSPLSDNTNEQIIALFYYLL